MDHSNVTEMEKLLSKVRLQSRSGLDNQKQASELLYAIEEAIKEQNQPLAPISYFGTLMTLIETQSEAESAIMVSATYLLAIIFPFIPTNVLRLKFTDITNLLEGSLLSYQDNAPVVKSVTGCLESLLFAQENSSWSSEPKCKELFQHLLSLCIDQRPKVRKRATDAVRKIIAFPPPPSVSHPATCFTVDFSIFVLQANQDQDSDSRIMDILVFLKVMAPLFVKQSKNSKVATRLANLTESLLSLPTKTGGGDVVLTQWVFEVLDSLLSSNHEDQVDFKVVYSLIASLQALSPNENDAVLTPLWLKIMTHAFARLGEFVCNYENEQQEYTEEAIVKFSMNEFSPLVSQFYIRVFSTWLHAKNPIKPVILTQVATTLKSLFEHCVSNRMVREAVETKSGDLFGMIKTVESTLKNILFRDKWAYILQICASIFHRLGQDHVELTQQILLSVMAFRDDKGYGSSFPFKSELDSSIYAAIQTIGIEGFLSLVPMNIENEYADQPRRPYLLSMLATALEVPLVTSEWVPYRVLGSHGMGYFVSTLVPLAERLFTKAGDFWSQKRDLEGKLYETLALQIWGLFPIISACLPNDVPTSFAKLAPILGKVLTSEPSALLPGFENAPDLRPTVCQGLQNLVESFQLLSELCPDEGDEDIKVKWKKLCVQAGNEAMEKIKVYVNRFLSALCNIYITVNPNITSGKATGQALQVLHEKSIQHYEKPIKKFLNVADKNSISDYMSTLVKSILQKQSTSMTQYDSLSVYALMDLILIVLPFLDSTFLGTPIEMYYTLCLGQLNTNDATLQKKTYKSLVFILKHIQIANIDEQALVVALLQDKVVSGVSSGATRARVQLIQLIVQDTKNKSLLLNFIPLVLPEVMLATKEANEKTRDGAYECLVSMARKMMSGSDALFIDRNIVKAMHSIAIDPQETPDDNEISNHVAEISIREFMMMVAAGLGGSSIHMTSAAVASLGRLMFEFSDVLDPELSQELIQTMLMCMELKNREVTKAVLGFVKVIITCLPSELILLNLQNIITSILQHTQHFKSYFKSKTRHIFERLIRKFTFEKVDEFFPESDKKLILNIKKRRESLKKRKLNPQTNEISTKTPDSTKKSFADTFHESGSELDSDGEDMDEDYIPDQFKEEMDTKRKTKSQTVIREGDVVDFLDKNVVSQVSHTRKSKQIKKTEFHTQDGKLVLENSDDKTAANNERNEDYYKQSLTSEVSFSRTADGRVKFNKRKRNADEDTGEIEVDPAVGKRWNASEGKKKQNIDTSKLLGRQYKAKKARGDVKRAGMPDPYAYIPLSGKIVGNMNKTAKIDGTLQNILKAAHKGGEAGKKARNQFKGINKKNKKHNN